jgi:hypothetical protein
MEVKPPLFQDPERLNRLIACSIRARDHFLNPLDFMASKRAGAFDYRGQERLTGSRESPWRQEIDSDSGLESAGSSTEFVIS